MAEAIAVTFCLSSVVLAGSSAHCDGPAEVSAGACGGPKAETAAVMDLEARSLDLSAGEDGAAAGEGDVTAGKGGNGAETAMPKKGASQCDEKELAGEAAAPENGSVEEDPPDSTGAGGGSSSKEDSSKSAAAAPRCGE